MKSGVLFGYGQNGLTPQARARADVAIEALNKKQISFIYISAVTGNYLKDYLSKSVPPSKIHIIPIALTTAAEIELLNKIVPIETPIVSISSWYHIPRIRNIWKAYGRNSSSIPSYGSVSIMDMIRELPLYFISLINPRAFSNRFK